MALHTIPASGISLHGAATHQAESKHTSMSAMLFRLNEEMLQDLRKASQSSGGLQFVTGKSPVCAMLRPHSHNL